MSIRSTQTTASREPRSLDYEFLRQEGIRHLAKLTGRLWTDFNAHDPGITILEQVCYALTDLAYRIEHEIPDMLHTARVDDHDSLPGSLDMLTSRPITQLDFRKLLIDQNGVKNAWIELHNDSDENPDFYHDLEANTLSFNPGRLGADPVFLKGLYRVDIEFEDALHVEGRQADRDAVWQNVVQKLHANRELGTDYAAINRLEAQYVQVFARIETAAVDDPQQVLLEIYEKISEHISPSVRTYTLTEMFDAGKSLDQILDGPPLEHGFIDTSELNRAQRRTRLRTSDLIQAIMHVSGVKAVRYIAVETDRSDSMNRPVSSTHPHEKNDISQYQSWLLKLDSGRVPKFDVTNSTILLERNGLSVKVDADTARTAYRRRLRRQIERESTIHAEVKLQHRQGKNRQIGRYDSIQHQFPSTYGIGAMGLPASAKPERQAQAKQLKAYLLFYDQILANYFAQLAHVKDLFSYYESNTTTYFSQVVDDPTLELDGIRQTGHADRLRELDQEIDSERNDQRRNRFLNHLLARFAEQFTDYTLLLFSAKTDQRKLIRDKQKYLQHFPELSSARNTAFNYLLSFDAHNRSGLEKRIQHKLGLDSPEEDFILIENILLRPILGDKIQTVPILSEVRCKDPFSLRLTFLFPLLAEPSRYGNQEFRRFVERTVREETPAHLSISIQWLTLERMEVVRRAYLAWVEQRRSFGIRRDEIARNDHGIK